MSFDFDTPIDRRNTGSNKWNRYPADVLPMWVADMDFAVAPPILAALRRRLEHPVFGYGAASDELRSTIVAMLARRYGWTVGPEALVFLPGVEPGFNMALKAYLAPGDGVVVQTPMYRPILVAPAHWGLRRVDVELRAGNDDAHATDMAALGAALDQSKALLFCNPHNPTGKVFTREELLAIGEACARRDVLIVSDEIHCDLLFDGRGHVPIASLSPALAARTITLMSASKTYNVAGLKTAFAIVPDAGLRERFAASRLGMVDSNNVIGLEATRAAFDHGEKWRRSLITYLQDNRDWLAAAVRERLPGIKMIRPEGTFLAWLDCSSLGLGDGLARFFLEEAKVGLSAGTEFGPSGRDFMRLNFGCPRATLADGVARIERALKTR
ncbi:MAG: putative C-S lyase [Alphaproteobacteria bacterium]|nr:putative C-S lyase [Alphaproteobacteria bacterium]